MDVTSLKKYIYEKEKVEYVLENIGCHDIKYHPLKEFWSCANHDGDNKGAVNVKNNQYLNVTNWTRDFKDGSDIVTLVQYNKQIDFIEALKYLHQILELDFKQIKKEKKNKNKSNPLNVFLKHKSNYKVDVAEINTIRDEVLDDYIPMLFIDWWKEGIMPCTKNKFGIMYSYQQNRIIIPLRYWLTGELLGINARTTVEHYKEFGIKKYFITPTYQKHLNLYGLYENKEGIKKAGYVVVYEAEKSVLKRDSVRDYTGVALSGHSMSPEQERIIKGLDVNEVVIALDNDIPIEEVWHMCEKFYQWCKVSYICDTWGFLKDKDAPADAPYEVFDFLFKNRVVYNEKKHKEYLKTFKKK